LFSKKEERKNEFLLHCKFAGRLQGAEEGAKGTLKFIPASISSSPHLPPSFLASLSPHCTSSSKTVFSTGGSIFSTGISCRNYRDPKVSTGGSLRVKKSLHEEPIILLTIFKPPFHHFQAYITLQASLLLFFSFPRKNTEKQFSVLKKRKNKRRKMHH